ncbi:hypothetical protein HY837_03850 [archaeon]|nr:hypothetical protein [archaeon]
MALELNVNSETGVLKEVVLGCPYTFNQVPLKILNERQKHFFGVNAPRKEKIIEEYENFKQCLIKNSVKIHEVEPVEGVQEQIFTRDVGFVINDVFVVSSMAKEERKNEIKGLNKILEKIHPSKILYAPENANIEGGDVIYDKEEIFVGIGQRTGLQGLFFLKKNFPNYKITPIYLKRPSQGEDVLHLDCSFMPICKEHAFLYRQGIYDLPRSFQDKYSFILLTKEEQQELFTNVLSLSPTKVISRKSSKKMNLYLEGLNVEVLELNFYETTKIGGAFRCASLPLYRI